MSTASPGRRRGSKAGRRTTTLEQGWLWGNPGPAASESLDEVRERRGAVLLRHAFQQAQDAVVVFGSDGVVAESNAHAVALLGLRKGMGVAGKIQGTPESCLSTLREGIDVTLHGSGMEDTALPLCAAAGQARQGRLDMKPIRDAEGRIAGVLCRVRAQPADERQEGPPAWVQRESRRLVHEYNNALSVLLGSLSMAVEEADGQTAELLLTAQAGALEAKRITEGLPGRLRTAALTGRSEPLALSAKWPIAGWTVSAAVRQALREIEPRLLRRLVVRTGHAVFGLIGEHSPVWLQADVAPGETPAEIEIAIGWSGGRGEQDDDVQLAQGRLHRLLASLGGRVNIKATSGGQALRFRLPLQPPAPEAGIRPRILLMDDEQPVRAVARRILEHAHYDVSESADGYAALTLFRQARSADRPFQLAILDLTVPGGMGGEEAGRHLRELDPDLPILISSGRMDGLGSDEIERLGIADVVPKPYTAAAMRAAVQHALRREHRTTA